MTRVFRRCNFDLAAAAAIVLPALGVNEPLPLRPATPPASNNGGSVAGNMRALSFQARRRGHGRLVILYTVWDNVGRGGGGARRSECVIFLFTFV